MKLSNTAINRIKELNEVKEMNIAVADMFLYLFSLGSLSTKEVINKIAEDKGIDPNTALLYVILDILELDTDNEEELDNIDKYIAKAIKQLSPEEYLNNPYVKAINIGDIKKGKYSLKKIKYEPYELFAYDDISIQDDYMELSNIGYFDKDFYYLALLEKDTIWMSLNPNEIETMEPLINEAKGDVLVLGLGLGYYAYMVALKDDVSSVTIIEKDPNIIALFKENILPHFPKNKTINIINDDAFKYLEKQKNIGDFATIFADLWHNPEDGITLYSRLLNALNNYKGKKLFWLEKGLLAMVRRYMLWLLMDYISNEHEADHIVINDDLDRLVLSLYKSIKDKEFNSSEDIDSLLSDETLKELLAK